jgi:hypothetical protein
MFHPYRYRDLAIYDLKALVPGRSPLVHHVYLEALRLIPTAFADRPPWGTKRPEGCVSIDVILHDRTYFEIRNRLSADVIHVRRVTERMGRDIAALGAGVVAATRAMNEVSVRALVGASVRAGAWFGCNWLHAKGSIRLALVRLFDPRRLEDSFELLLMGDHFPVFVQAYLALEDVRNGSMTPDTYLQLWGPAYAAGSQQSPVRTTDDVSALLDGKLPDHLAVVTRRRQNRLRERDVLCLEILDRCNAEYGAAPTELLRAQLEYLNCCVWQEETRHLYQQQAFAAIEQWRQSAEPRGDRIGSFSRCLTQVTAETCACDRSDR